MGLFGEEPIPVVGSNVDLNFSHYNAVSLELIENPENDQPGTVLYSKNHPTLRVKLGTMIFFTGRTEEGMMHTKKGNQLFFKGHAYSEHYPLAFTNVVGTFPESADYTDAMKVRYKKYFKCIGRVTKLYNPNVTNVYDIYLGDSQGSVVYILSLIHI